MLLVAYEVVSVHTFGSQLVKVDVKVNVNGGCSIGSNRVRWSHKHFEHRNASVVCCSYSLLLLLYTCHNF